MHHSPEANQRATRGLTFFDDSPNCALCVMVNIARPTTTAPTYVKVADFPGLYRHSSSGRYYACKKLHGVQGALYPFGYGLSYTTFE